MSIDPERDNIAERIERLIADIPGWTPFDELLALYVLAVSLNRHGGDIVEVGSWCGRSAVVLGMAATATGNARVHAIDLFPSRSDWFRNEDGSYSFRVDIEGGIYRAYHEQTVWAEPFERDIVPIYAAHDSLEEIITENIATAGLTGVVLPHRGDLGSFLASRPKDFRCKLAFIDGDHGYDAVAKDIRTIEPHLEDGGWLCFDDAFTCYDGVDRAISEFIASNSQYELHMQLTRKLFVAQKSIVQP